MEESLSILDLLIAISRLPEDRPANSSGKWYRTQKEHWIGWLFEYNGPGAYGRHTQQGRDAKFVYNHVVEPRMLLYLAKAAGVSRGRVLAARKKLGGGRSLMQQAAEIRRLLPWELVAKALSPRPAEEDGVHSNTMTRAPTERTKNKLEQLQRALSIRQPFAEQILTGKKRREYRSRQTWIRGRVYLYAGKALADASFAGDVDSLPRGYIVGSIEIAGCKAMPDGGYAWLLEAPRRYRQPIATRGVPQPGFWYPKLSRA